MTWSPRESCIDAAGQEKSTWARIRDPRIRQVHGRQTDWRILRLDKSGCPASRPATEMSSSSASQCKPPLLSSTWARCSALASSRRGNQASGAAIVLPSAKLTHMVSSSNRTALGEVFIPGPFNQVFVRRNHGSQVSKGASIEPVAVGKIDRRRQPEFCLTFSGPLGFGVQQNAPAPARRRGHGPSAKAFPHASDLCAAGHAKCKH